MEVFVYDIFENKTLHPRKEKPGASGGVIFHPCHPIMAGHLSTKTTFLCPQDGCHVQVQLFVYKSYFAKSYSEATDTGLPGTLVVVR